MTLSALPTAQSVNFGPDLNISVITVLATMNCCSQPKDSQFPATPPPDKVCLEFTVDTPTEVSFIQFQAATMALCSQKHIRDLFCSASK